MLGNKFKTFRKNRSLGIKDGKIGRSGDNEIGRIARTAVINSRNEQEPNKELCFEALFKTSNIYGNAHQATTVIKMECKRQSKAIGNDFKSETTTGKGK